MKERLKKIIDKVWNFTDDMDYETILTRSEKPFENEKPHFTDEQVNQSYANDNSKWTHNEFIKKYSKPVIVEPDFAFCITGFNKILLSSAFYSNLRPSFPRYVRSFFKKCDTLPQAVILDGKVGTNYFHFFSDIVNKIWLINTLPNARQIPIITGEKLFNTKFFKYIYENTELKNYSWYIQRAGQYVKVNEVYLVRAMPYDKTYFENIRALLKVPKTAGNRRVFLNRSRKSGRYIENFDEIKPVLDKYDFEIVDTDNAELPFQINLFSSARYLIGIHGAGNTNIIFAGKDLRFLEINPANRISCHYYWIAITNGIAYYDIILGGNLPAVQVYPEKGFYLDPAKLENAIVRMLS